jgi:DNA adenine methylase
MAAPLQSALAHDGSPLLKWVGGKTKMLPHLLPHYSGQPRVIEPFFGGGALSFHLSATNPELEVVGNDFLEPLIDVYDAIRTDVEGFIQEVESYAAPYLRRRTLETRRAHYYKIRDSYMQRTLDGPEVLFFMLWCAYSGMYRTGKTYPGRFNTPHGFGKETQGFYHPERLRAAAPVMRHWDLLAGDFSAVLPKVTSDSFVFLDPPYRETYTGYTDDGFSEADQLRVVEFFKAAHAAGAKVVYTNKDLQDGFYRKHFKGFTIQRAPIRYTVNRNSATVGRPVSHEVVISN